MGHKILLADDSITIQKVIELTFSDEDFELHTVGNGQKAIDEIRSIMPHIVLCDIIMPEKNGYEVCEFIKSSADLKHIPVLLLTGAFEPFDQERARAAGCDGFLAKPFEPQTLISKVKELLAKAPAAAPAPRAAAPRPAAAPPSPPPAARPPAPAAPPPVQRAQPTPAPPPPSRMEFESDERTVMMPPSSLGAPPAAPRGAQASPASVPPPPPPPVDFGSGLDDRFAVEAGERELLMGEEDHTVLLGGREPKGGSARAEGSDDIWSEVASPMSSEDEDSSTVFMSPPSPIAPPAQQTPQTFTSSGYNEIQYEADDLDATWGMPNAEPQSPPAPDYGGFEEFAEPVGQGAASYAPPPIPEPSFGEENVPPLVMPPPLSSTPEPATFEDYMPSASTGGAEPPPFEPPKPFSTDATIDSALSDEFERIPTTSGFESYGEPEILAESEPEPMKVMEPSEPVFETKSAPPSPLKPVEHLQSFDEIDANETPLSEFEDVGSVGEEIPSAGGGVPLSIDDALIEKVAQRVVDKLSQKVIQEIAWEVVPDLAEGLILKEIAALKAKMPKST